MKVVGPSGTKLINHDKWSNTVDRDKRLAVCFVFKVHVYLGWSIKFIQISQFLHHFFKINAEYMFRNVTFIGLLGLNLIILGVDKSQSTATYNLLTILGP